MSVITKLDALLDDPAVDDRSPGLPEEIGAALEARFDDRIVALVAGSLVALDDLLKAVNVANELREAAADYLSDPTVANRQALEEATTAADVALEPLFREEGQQ